MISLRPKRAAPVVARRTVILFFAWLAGLVASLLLINALIPQVGGMNSLVRLSLAVVVFQAVYVGAHRTLVDVMKLKYYRTLISDFRRKQRQALKTHDWKLLRELTARQEVMKRIMAEVGKESFKPMILSFLSAVFLFAIFSRDLSQPVLRYPFPIWFDNVKILSGLWFFILLSLLLSSLASSLMKAVGWRV